MASAAEECREPSGKCQEAVREFHIVRRVHGHPVYRYNGLLLCGFIIIIIIIKKVNASIKWLIDKLVGPCTHCSLRYCDLYTGVVN